MIMQQGALMVQIKNGVRTEYTVGQPEYGVLSAVLSRQEGAAATNTIVTQTYNRTIANLQISVDNFKTVEQPPKPLMWVIDDEGNETHVAFDPPLHDLVFKPPVKAGPPVIATAPPIGTGYLTAEETRTMYNKIDV